MNFSSEVVNEDKLKEFEGSLPTTIYHEGFSEVYGQYPDIDSTALMLSATSWILVRTLKEEEESPVRHLPEQPVIAAEHSSNYVSALLSKVGITDPSKVTDFVIPKMLKAIDYLISRDKDNDGLNKVIVSLLAVISNWHILQFINFKLWCSFKRHHQNCLSTIFHKLYQA
ncbi:MAG: hypothetical protein WA364_10235 [Candidatus Nitrosopolaris sp.]